LTDLLGRLTEEQAALAGRLAEIRHQGFGRDLPPPTETAAPAAEAGPAPAGLDALARQHRPARHLDYFAELDADLDRGRTPD
jgi:hypothetical protein